MGPQLRSIELSTARILPNHSLHQGPFFPTEAKIHVQPLRRAQEGARLPEGNSQEAERLVGSGGCEAGSEVGLTQATLGAPEETLGRIWHVYRQHEWRVQRDMELAPKLAPWVPRVLTSSFYQIVCRPRVYRRESR